MKKRNSSPSREGPVETAGSSESLLVVCVKKFKRWPKYKFLFGESTCSPLIDLEVNTAV